ncbi:hypothetical protein F511_31656 [Dorcoceras hygrometricum]|uniref:Uncharacterized protein n=1 Tax=Dorcoceras hygrometricum TaxID=472368 RepID=A0A2Z7D0Q5_9LAMI|nr:hypothetical protein F511_31656 [Dorcoceras hygrometricum]
MVKRLATSPHDPLGITDSACKNQLVMVGVQYGPFNSNIPIRSTTIGKSRVARDPITMHTSRRSNSDIACVTRRLAPTNFTRKLALQRLTVVVLRIRSMTEIKIPLSVCTRKHDKYFTDGISSSIPSEQVRRRRQRTAHGGSRICVARDFVVVIIAQKFEIFPYHRGASYQKGKCKVTKYNKLKLKFDIINNNKGYRNYPLPNYQTKSDTITFKHTR